MKKLVALGLATAFAANVAHADPIMFDPDGPGGNAPVRLDVMTLDIIPAQTYSVFQDFGADNTLNAGDTFTESFTYNFSIGSDTAANTAVVYGFDLAFSFDLTGYIDDVTYGTGTAPTVGSPTFAADLAGTSFKTVFNPTSVSPTVNMTATYLGNVIGVFDLIAGVSGTPVQLAGNINSAFIFDFKFNEAWKAGFADFDSTWFQMNGDPLDSNVTFAIGEGSAAPTGNIAISGAPGQFVADIEIKDNGATLEFRVPEPASIAALGLGLLGLAGFRRKA